ncbi:MAG: hypothetical protein HC783_08465 [Rhodobacteraceae bacterium]|nr:hypothetical protein [Paracoccaceae bacterium]
MPTPFHRSLRILHFHAQDPAAWERSLPFRLSQGAYNCDADRPLQTHLTDASPEVIRLFYADTMTLTPEKAALLQEHGRMITCDLSLRAKVGALLAGHL